MTDDLLKTGEVILDLLRSSGAGEGDVYLVRSKEFELTLREGRIEVLKQAVARGVGVRILHDQRLGFSHTNDLRPDSLRELVARTLAMARHATRDEFLGLPDLPSASGGDLDLVDPALEGLTTEAKIEMARTMEEAARDADPRVKVVEGASFSDEQTETLLLNTEGFVGSYRGTASGLACAVVAEENGKKQIDHWYSSRRKLADHEPPAEVGRKAAERAVRMLGARSVPPGRFPVIFDPLMAASFLSAVASALNGESVYRKLSFLTEKLGERIGPDTLTITDDGIMPKGLASRPFDGEGVATSHKPVVRNGVLASFLYDSTTARKAGVTSTGNAVRSYSSLPHIGHLNLFIESGEYTPEQIFRSVREGFYVTGMIGFGVDTVSGQFSRGANGIWIRDGEPAFPVHEVTIAGNMLDMLGGIDMVGNDLEFRGSIASPTIRLRELTISGQERSSGGGA